MPALLLLCGPPPGSGKTTLAARLERERPALRLTPDEWIEALAIDPQDEEKRAVVEALQWKVAARLSSLALTSFSTGRSGRGASVTIPVASGGTRRSCRSSLSGRPA